MTTDPHLLLINPHVVDVALYDLWSRPLGLLYIASILRHNGIGLSLIDLMDRRDPYYKKINDKEYSTGKYHWTPHCDSPFPQLPQQKLKRYGLPDEEFIRRLKKIPSIPSAVLMTSGMTYWYRGIEHTARLIRSIFPDTPIYLGGTAAVLDPETYEDMEIFDGVFTGSDLLGFYLTLESLLDRTLDFKPLKREDYPAADWSWYSSGAAAIQSSWGCVHRCSYCASHSLHPEFFQRSVEDVSQELLSLEKSGFSDIAFYDDAILVNSSHHFEPILKKASDMGFSADLHLPNAVHPQFVTAENATEMFKSGVRTVAIGYDTISARIRQNKEYPVAVAVKHLKDSGFTPDRLWCYLLAGLPEQNKSELLEAMDDIHNMGIRLRLAWFSPIPGTPDFNKVKGLQIPDYYNNSYYAAVSEVLGPGGHEELKHKERQLNRSIYG